MLQALIDRTKNMTPATARQRELRLLRIVDYFRSYQARNFGQAPTCREIAQATDMPSLSIVARYLRLLHKEGLLARVRNHYCLPRVIDWYTPTQESHAIAQRETRPSPGASQRPAGEPAKSPPR